MRANLKTWGHLHKFSSSCFEKELFKSCKQHWFPKKKNVLNILLKSIKFYFKKQRTGERAVLSPRRTAALVCKWNESSPILRNRYTWLGVGRAYHFCQLFCPHTQHSSRAWVGGDAIITIHVMKLETVLTAPCNNSSISQTLSSFARVFSVTRTDWGLEVRPNTSIAPEQPSLLFLTKRFQNIN